MSSNTNASVTRQVHLIPTTLDYISESVQEGRAGPVFNRTGADKAYVLYNSNPKGHDLHEESREAVIEVVENLTFADERGGIIPVGIDFYDFNNAVADVYKVMYKEYRLKNEITVHISGGTKLVAMALAFACVLTDTDEIDIYYVAKQYELQDGEPTSTDIIDEPFPVSPLNQLQMDHLIPVDNEKRTIIRGLHSAGEPKGITEILNKFDVFESSDDSRSAINSRYHRHKDTLEEQGVIETESGKLDLTPTGELIGKLLNQRQKVDDELT